MKKFNEIEFWEQVNYSADLDFCKQFIEGIFSDEEIFNKSVIDIGCGTGMYSFIFKQKGAKKVTGIDLSESSIKTARNNLERAGLRDVQFLNADIRNYDFKDRHFDIIWCHGMIYYLQEPFNIIHKVCELVDKKGILFISLQKDAYYAKIINSIRKVLHGLPKSLWGLTSSFISLVFLFILFVFHKETNFKRIKTKVLAQYFPVSYIDLKKVKKIFLEMNFNIEKVIDSIDIFPYTTDFGLKLRKLR